MWPLVLHVDMDAFFASVEVRSDPRLAGRALVVGGGPGGRGVVTTASYPARRFGIGAGMSLAEARRRCPGLLVLPVRPAQYVHESIAVLDVLDRLSPRVEAASIDEAYVELGWRSPVVWHEEARVWGERIRSEIHAARGLPASVGAAVNKLQAKMASPLAKPDGLAVLDPVAFRERFAGEPVGRIPGVGPRSVEALRGLGIHTVGDLAASRPDRLAGVFGRGARDLVHHARGRDGRGVIAAEETPAARSAGHETTFARDVADPDALRATLWLLADRVARRLRRGRQQATVGAVRFKVGRKRFSRQRTLAEPTQDGRVLARVAWSLLEPARAGRALRLLGVAGMRLRPACGPEPLFEDDRRGRRLTGVEDRLRDRFGESILLPGEVYRRDDERG